MPQSQVVFPSPGTPSNNVNSPRADGRSVTSEDTRSDSGDDDDMDDTAMANLSVGQSIIRVCSYWYLVFALLTDIQGENKVVFMLMMNNFLYLHK